MRLMHYSEHPVDFDHDRTYAQYIPTTFGKPNGFWVSVQGEDDWHDWCTEQGFHLDALRVPHEVTLDMGKFLVLESVRAFDHLQACYAVPTDLDRGMPWRGENNWAIDWRKVAADWDGIIIAPYQWGLRNVRDWYYGWDCASGCIWNPKVIKSVEVCCD
jgi:hypothetical protein